MASEKRLIDANALKRKIGQVCLYVASLRCGKTIISKILESYRNAVFEEIDNAPTVDAVEVVHGRWIDKTEWIGSFGQIKTECSVCGTIYPHKPGSRGDGKGGKFCEECGARMDGAE